MSSSDTTPGGTPATAPDTDTKLTPKQWVTAIAVIGGITAAVILTVIHFSNERSRRQSAAAEPIGFVATPTTWTDAQDHDQEGHTLTYGYAVGGQAYSKTEEEVTWYSPDKQFKVCYDPKHPEDAELYLRDHVCGS